jgi:hypothetical protein
VPLGELAEGRQTHGRDDLDLLDLALELGIVERCELGAYQ